MLIAAIQTVYGDKCFVRDADYDNHSRYPVLMPLYTHDGIKHASLDPTDKRLTPGGALHLHRENIASILMVYEVAERTATLHPDFGRGIHVTTPGVDNRPIGQRTRPDPEAIAREDVDAAAPRAEVLDTWTEAAAWQRSFGTRPRVPLKPARQDDLFDPIPQGRLF